MKRCYDYAEEEECPARYGGWREIGYRIARKHSEVPSCWSGRSVFGGMKEMSRHDCLISLERGDSCKRMRRHLNAIKDRASLTHEGREVHRASQKDLNSDFTMAKSERDTTHLDPKSNEWLKAHGLNS